jgi:hypothetical protein
MTSSIKIYTIGLFLLTCSSLFAQDNTQFTQGTVSDSATLSLGVPLRSYKGRGIDLPVSLSYSSSVWRLQHHAKMYNSATGAWHNVTEAGFQSMPQQAGRAASTFLLLNFRSRMRPITTWGDRVLLATVGGSHA